MNSEAPGPDIVTASKSLLTRAKRLTNGRSRDKAKYFIADTPRVIHEAFEAGADVSALLVTPEGAEGCAGLLAQAASAGVDVALVDEEAMSAISSAMTPQGVAAIVGFADGTVESAAAESLVLLLAGVQDPGNVGALLRTADGVGAGVLLSKGCADLYNSKVVRSSAGALFRIPAVRNVEISATLDYLSSGRFALVGTDPDGDVLLGDFEFPPKTVIVVGNEAAGLPRAVADRLDYRIAIPMRRPGQSLNVAIAGSIVLVAAADKARHRTDLAAVVSAINHDLRSPLTSVRGFAATLTRRWGELDDDLKKEMVGQLFAGSERLMRAIGELVDTARIETGEIRFAPVEFDPRPLVEEACRELSETFPDIKVEICVDDLRSGLYADRDRFIQALAVLLENAAKHGKGHVRVTGRESGGASDVEVLDDGPGLDDDQVELVLSADIATRKRGIQPAGTGLSLHVVTEAAKLQGGGLRASRPRGGGMAFVLTLPSGGGAGRSEGNRMEVGE